MLIRMSLGVGGRDFSAVVVYAKCGIGRHRGVCQTRPRISECRSFLSRVSPEEFIERGGPPAVLIMMGWLGE